MIKRNYDGLIEKIKSYASGVGKVAGILTLGLATNFCADIPKVKTSTDSRPELRTNTIEGHIETVVSTADESFHVETRRYTEESEDLIGEKIETPENVRTDHIRLPLVKYIPSDHEKSRVRIHGYGVEGGNVEVDDPKGGNTYFPVPIKTENGKFKIGGLRTGLEKSRYILNGSKALERKLRGKGGILNFDESSFPLESIATEIPVPNSAGVKYFAIPLSKDKDGKIKDADKILTNPEMADHIQPFVVLRVPGEGIVLESGGTNDERYRVFAEAFVFANSVNGTEALTEDVYRKSLGLVEDTEVLIKAPRDPEHTLSKLTQKNKDLENENAGLENENAGLKEDYEKLKAEPKVQIHPIKKSKREHFLEEKIKVLIGSSMTIEEYRKSINILPSSE